jgi:demethylmenaquinone methyltransferase/2-methoxy-6-polyprenyl-1,4-benzoquinol methylase
MNPDPLNGSRFRQPTTTTRSLPLPPMAKFSHDNITPFEDGSKKEQVSEMFNDIAERYDLMNRLLSVGIDRLWRKKAIKWLKNDHPKHILDIATGTGDMAIMAAKLLKPESVTGIDISEKMLEIGRKKIEKEQLGTKIELLRGDSETINFPNNSFDGGMVAFGVRNFENLEKGLSEIHRVLQPGARLVVLEFSQPTLPGVKALYNLYMGKIAPQVAQWFRQNKKAYQYLNESAKAFPERKNFEQILKQTEFSDTQWKPLSLGICCIYSGRKPIN